MKFGSKSNQALAMSGSKDGFSVATGGADPIPAPKAAEPKPAAE